MAAGHYRFYLQRDGQSFPESLALAPDCRVRQNLRNKFPGRCVVRMFQHFPPNRCPSPPDWRRSPRLFGP